MNNTPTKYFATQTTITTDWMKDDNVKSDLEIWLVLGNYFVFSFSIFCKDKCLKMMLSRKSFEKIYWP